MSKRGDHRFTVAFEEGIEVKHILFFMSVVVIVLTSSLAMGSPTAQADDEHACGETFKHEYYDTYVQRCPLWRGDVPVFSKGGLVVGFLEQGGNANWFKCQELQVFNPHSVDGYVNYWWAETVADNGRWGWVSLVYFAGGDDWEPDATLRYC
jgi:hypothetical protein